MNFEKPCLEYQGAVAGQRGYGRISRNGTKILVHRLAYEEVHGPIPEGLVIDHLCRNKRCYEVTHLEAVTIAENTLRADPGKFQREKTACIHGHPYTPENTLRDTDGFRACRECNRLRLAAKKDYYTEYRRKRRAAGLS